MKIRNPEIYIPFIIEILLQTSTVGFNSMLSDKLLNEYTFSKNRSFFLNLFLSLIYISIYIIFIRGIKFTLIRDKRYQFNWCYLYCNDLFILIYFLCLFSMSSFIYSILYFKNNFPKDNELENTLSSMATIFKCLDFQMLSYYDFFEVQIA